MKTVEDFGSQGAEPSHPELLDWLASSFVTITIEHEKLLKTIVSVGHLSPEFTLRRKPKRKDPYNVWLSRGPRVRLSAEQVRDQALACSGLISNKMYGPSVMPPQPDKIRQSPYSGESWAVSAGEDKYRRGSLYLLEENGPIPVHDYFRCSQPGVLPVEEDHYHTLLQATGQP